MFDMDVIDGAVTAMGRVIEIIGILIILGAIILGLIKYPINKRKGLHDAYQRLRKDLSQGILLGLEILVAADIIATVANEPTLRKALTLAIIVIVRTFLSLSLIVEVEGQFPWQRKANGENDDEHSMMKND